MSVGLFPGQGVPSSAILEALTPGDPLLHLADETLGYGLRHKVEVGGRASTLPTKIAQPAIFVASLIACQDRLREGASFSHLIGHSLGEFAALVAAGALSFGDGLRAVAVRGEAMHKAAQQREGGMVALLGGNFEALCDIAETAGVVVANDNSPKQIVVAGSDEALETVATLARTHGARAVRLPVEASFHTDAMSPAEDALAEVLFGIGIRSPKVPVISNVTARPYRSPGEIRRLLVDQLTTPVRFRESVEEAWNLGARDFVDIGPGAVVGRLAAQTKEALATTKAVAHV